MNSFKKIAATAAAVALTFTGTAICSAIAPNNSHLSLSSITALAYYQLSSSDGNWYFYVENNTAILAKYRGNGVNIIVPESIKNSADNKSYSVKGIERGCFKDNTKIKTVTIPRGITKIDNYTFSGATNLYQVILPHGIKTIGTGAFEKTNIQSISLPSTLEEIQNYAFDSSALTSLTIPSSVKKISYNAFYNCKNLKNVVFQGTCQLDTNVFYGCNSLTNINMNIATFEKACQTGSLGNCPNLKKINGIVITKIDGKGEPYFSSPYSSYLTQNFAINDTNKVSFMDDYISAKAKCIVKNETAGCTTDAQKIKKLHNYVCRTINYAYDSKGNPEESPEVRCDSSIFFRKTTICDGYARGMALLLNTAGIETHIVVSDDHAWNIVKLNNRYFHLDACHDGGDDAIYYDHYLKSDNDIKKCTSGHGKWRIVAKSSRTPRTPGKTPVCSYSLGDVNMDGVVNSNDAAYLKKIVSKVYTAPDKTLADIDGNGVIDTTDLFLLSDLY